MTSPDETSEIATTRPPRLVRRLFWLAGIAIPAALVVVATWPETQPPRRDPKARVSAYFGTYPVVFSPDGRIMALNGGDPSWSRHAFVGGASSNSPLDADAPSPLPRRPPEPSGATVERASRVGIEFRDAATGGLRSGHPVEVLSLGDEPGGSIIESGTAWPIEFSPDGSLLVGRREMPTPGLRIWDVATGRARATLPLPEAARIDVQFTPDSQTLLASMLQDPDRNRIRRWDTRTWQSLGEDLVLATQLAQEASFSPDGSLLAIKYRGRPEIGLVDVASGRERSTLVRSVVAGTIPPVKDLRFSPDGRTLAARGEDRYIRIWDVESGRLRATIGLEPLRDRAVWAIEGVTMAFAPGSKTLAVGHTYATNDSRTDDLLRVLNPILNLAPPRIEHLGRVIFLDAKTGRRVATLNGVQKYLDGLAFAPDGRTMATTGTDQYRGGGLKSFGDSTLLWSITPDR